MTPRLELEDDIDDSAKRNKIISLISKYTRHKFVKLVQRGNAAIFCALKIALTESNRKFILVPDQGGWISFLTYPQILGFDIRKVKTDKGIIDLAHLEKESKDCAAFLVTSFAGYFAEQPMEEISKICRKNGCLLIEDASGAIGDKTLCDGKLSDIIVGSFGQWKPVNNCYGGFISVKDKGFFERSKDIFSTTNFFPDYDLLLKKLEAVPERLKSMIALADETKKELSKEFPGLELMHPGRRGLNIAIKIRSDKDKKDIDSYCKKKCFNYVECPEYARTNEDAIVIELKRI